MKTNVRNVSKAAIFDVVKKSSVDSRTINGINRIAILAKEKIESFFVVYFPKAETNKYIILDKAVIEKIKPIIPLLNRVNRRYIIINTEIFSPEIMTMQ